jgi:hypothetical protein
MRHVLLSICLTVAAFSAPTALDLRTAIPSSLNCIPSTELVVPPSDQHEVHAAVVDMPQRASLAHASPETWDTLPMSDPPYEQAPATTVLQVAMH